MNIRVYTTLNLIDDIISEIIDEELPTSILDILFLYTQDGKSLPIIRFKNTTKYIQFIEKFVDNIKEIIDLYIINFEYAHILSLSGLTGRQKTKLIQYFIEVFDQMTKYEHKDWTYNISMKLIDKINERIKLLIDLNVINNLSEEDVFIQILKSLGIYENEYFLDYIFFNIIRIDP